MKRFSIERLSKVAEPIALRKDCTQSGTQGTKHEKHHPALHYTKVPATLRAIEQSTAEPITKLAFRFLILTAGRSGKVGKAIWSEIDLEKRIWTIPADRKKARQQHQVPLSSKALAILDYEAREYNNEPGGLVFPTHSGEPPSDMTLTVLLRRLGIPAVPHGFRSSFKAGLSAFQAA